MSKKHLLFICTENLDRSPTAERLFLHSDKYEAKSAGTSPTADTRLSASALEWADIVFCMEEKHKVYIEGAFPRYKNKEVHVLEIPDCYHEGSRNLIKLLEEKLKNYLN